MRKRDIFSQGLMSAPYVSTSRGQQHCSTWTNHVNLTDRNKLSGYKFFSKCNTIKQMFHSLSTTAFAGSAQVLLATLAKSGDAKWTLEILAALGSGGS